MLFNANHLCDILRRFRKRRLTYTSGTGAPVVGQTVTGVASTKTAVISRIGTGYIVVKDLSGAFTTGEALRVGASPYTFTGTLSAQADYQNTEGEYEHYWYAEQSSVRCRFYNSSARLIIVVSGAATDKPLRLALPTTITMTPLTVEEYKIVTTEAQYAGTYTVERLDTLPGMLAGVDHFEATLREA
jgi:hypothetical protein